MFNLLFTILISLSNATEFHCIIDEAGDLPKIKFRGSTREESMERTVRLCLNLRIQNYTSKRLSPPSTERTILFMEDCVNKTYCKEVSK